MKWIIAALIVALPILAWTHPVFAHDHWINAGRYRSPVDGMLCCGKNDCVVLSAEDVKITAAGYLLPAIGDVVPFREALPSEDGKYHRCHRPDGSRRCFFAPQQGS